MTKEDSKDSKRVNVLFSSEMFKKIENLVSDGYAISIPEFIRNSVSITIGYETVDIKQK